MAKVLLIQGNYDIGSFSQSYPWMPLALVELASFLREKGHEAKILDRNLYPDNNKLINMLKKFNPDIVGITCYTSPVIKDVKQVSKIVKENSQAVMIVGGTHATLEPKSLLDYAYIDYIIRGEGELALLEICNLVGKNQANRKNILKIKNVNYNNMRQFLNLDELPVPDYDFLEVKKYPIATFYTSRGCPGKCRFCYNLGRQLRFYNTDKTIQAITNVLDKHKIREFTIADDNFANLSKRTEKICNAISKYNVIFHAFQRVDQTQDEVMKNLKKAGCWAIQFGFESGSQRILDFINKGTTVSQNINAISQCKKYNIFVDGSFMTGLPTETLQEMQETASFIKTYKPDAVDIKVFTPYPSTELYEYCIKQNLMKRFSTLDEWENFGNLKQTQLNVSKIPSPILFKTVNELSKTPYSTYFKKTFLLMKNRHFSYVLFKLKTILKTKLGLQSDIQKVKINQ